VGPAAAPLRNKYLSSTVRNHSFKSPLLNSFTMIGEWSKSFEFKKNNDCPNAEVFEERDSPGATLSPSG